MGNVFRKLCVEGVQGNSMSTEAFTKNEICQLWDSGALLTTPKGLLCAVFVSQWNKFLSARREGAP